MIRNRDLSALSIESSFEKNEDGGVKITSVIFSNAQETVTKVTHVTKSQILVDLEQEMIYLNSQKKDVDAQMAKVQDALDAINIL